MASVAVLGPGAVGGLVAVRLAAAGHDVTCVARPETARAIRRDGLTLETPAGTTRARIAAVERLEQPVTLLVVAVKAYDLERALDRVGADAAADGAVVPLLNGLEHLATLRARLGAPVPAASIGRLEAYREGPARIVQSTPAPVVTLSAQHPAAGPAGELLEGAGLAVRTAPTDAETLWEKLARLAPLAGVTSVSQLPVGALREDASWRARLQAALAEACAVARADGAGVSAASQWEMIAAMPAALTTSTARDVAAGRPSEADAIVGAVVRAGHRHGVATPELAALLDELVRR